MHRFGGSPHGLYCRLCCVVDVGERNRSMSLPPASERETAVSLAKDPDTETDPRHPVGPLLGDRLEGHGRLVDD